MAAQHALRAVARRLWVLSVGSLALLAATGALAATQWVTTGADAGPGSLRAAVEAANADSAVTQIRFRPGISVEVDEPVVYTGAQRLTLDGHRSSISGSIGATPGATWDAGLFVSRAGADIVIRNLSFFGSFNNGVGIFLPGDATGTLAVKLIGVVIDGSRFHGLYIDGQVTDDYDTDDVIHPDCVDPWPVDSSAGVSLLVRNSEITGNGTLAGGFDTGTPYEVDGETFLTGCPADFDGIRVDDGGPGGIDAYVTRAIVEDNLADGIEYDERGEGDVWSFTGWSSVARNGETGTPDLDDGIDLDEEGPGDLTAIFFHVDVLDNRDEGLDLDEAGEGSAHVSLVKVESSRNEDQGLKVDESDEGDLVVSVRRSVIDDSLSQHGIELSEEGDGDLEALVSKSEVTGNDDAAIAGEQEPDGSGTLTVRHSNVAGNGDPSFDLTGIALDVSGSVTD